ncbi:MAG: hypothetical protein IPQ03_13245 [Bacteroidetes bacterium]|nr:hypothetical protein [Bacteroidota bacterium]
MIKMMGKNVKKIEIRDKKKTIYRYLYRGFIFDPVGPLAGACPAPMFILLGAGCTVFIVYLLVAMTGTFVYGMLRKREFHIELLPLNLLKIFFRIYFRLAAILKGSAVFSF